MAITFVSGSYGTSGVVASVSSGSATVNAGSAPGRLVVALVLFRSTGSSTVSSATYNGVAMSKATNSSYNGNLAAEIWYLADAASGSNTLSVTFSGTVSQAVVHGAAWAGAATSSVLDNVNSGTGNSAAPSVSVTPSENDCLVVGGIIHEAVNALTVGSGETSLADVDHGAWVTSASYAIQTTAGAQDVNWSAGASDTWACAVASFRAGESNSAPTISPNTADEAVFNTGTPTLEFTGSDVDDDDLRYNVQISDNPDFSSGSAVQDSYNTGMGVQIHPNPSATTNWLSNYHVDDRPGQSFTANGGTLDKIRVRFGGDALTDGTVYIRVYTHAGTYGTSSAPANAAAAADTPTPDWLAISDAYPFDLVNDTETWRTITFSGANRIHLEPGERYIWILDWVPATTDYTNTITVQGDGSTLSHAGNCYIDGFSGANNGPHSEYDLFFEVYEVGLVLDKTSGTDSGFANTVTGGDTDPFNAGEKVSFTVQAGDTLDPGTYWWRARVSDPGGLGDWSSWTTARSFTVEESTPGSGQTQLMAGKLGGLLRGKL